jgi:hypothetical protein
MALNFADLKKNRASDFAKIQKNIEDDKKGGYSDKKDEWSPAVDKAGNGYAVVRFLPAPPNEDAAWVKLYTHGFKGPSGKWYIENSRTTIGEKDPVGEFNSELYNSTEDQNDPRRKQATAQKRRLSYIANVLIIKDPANPQNEGTVKKYRFGKKIWDKINDAMYPDEADKLEGKEGYNPFDFWEGADFKIKIRQVEGYRNYDKSEFDSRSVVSEDEDFLEKIWKESHSLQAIIAPDQFKSYEELQKKMNEVLGLDRRAQGGSSAQSSRAEQASDEPAYRPKQAESRQAAAAEESSLPWKADEGSSESASAGGDDDLDFFRKLAEG